MNEGPILTWTDAEIAFLNARLDEDEATAKRASACTLVQRDGYRAGDWSWLRSYGQPQAEQIALVDHQSRFDPARVLDEVQVWRGILLDFQMPPAAAVGIPARPGDLPTPRELHAKEVGFRLALLAALKAKITTYSDHPDYRPEWKPAP